MFVSLLGTRRFAPLFWCQFFSAFNDNFVRNMLAIIILFHVGSDKAGSLVSLAIAIFVLPGLFLSSVGGELADSHDKAFVARRLKLAELFVQALASLGFLIGSLPLLFASLFGLGIISALFGPIKYGILPDHLKTQELPAANALVEAGTFLAILIGLIAGGLAAAQGRSPVTIVAQLMIIALLCWISSLFIPSTAVAAPGLKPRANVFASSFAMIAELARDPLSFVGGLAVAWFWMTGAVALSLVPVIVRERIGGGVEVETMISALFAIGIGLGSLAAAIMARGRIILTPVPLAAFGMAIFAIDIGRITLTLPQSTETIGLAAFFTGGVGLHLAIDLVALAAAGGLFVVPAFTAVQAWAGERRRARTIAAVNVLAALFMIAGSLLTSLLQSPLVGLSEPVLIMILGVLNAAMGLWLFAKFRRNLSPVT